MNVRFARFLVLGVVGVALTGGCAWKDYRDYCDKCSTTFNEDGCKAAAKSEWKFAKSIGCKKEFKELASCLGDVNSCADVSCVDETTDYYSCVCKEGASDRSDCDGLDFF